MSKIIRVPGTSLDGTPIEVEIDAGNDSISIKDPNTGNTVGVDANGDMCVKVRDGVEIGGELDLPPPDALRTKTQNSFTQVPNFTQITYPDSSTIDITSVTLVSSHENPGEVVMSYKNSPTLGDETVDIIPGSTIELPLAGSQAGIFLALPTGSTGLYRLYIYAVGNSV